MEGVVQFKYMGQLLDQTDNDYPVILLNIKRDRKFWG